MSENKRRMAVWMYPDTFKKVESKYKEENFKSQSEFIEKAVLFYYGYLLSSETTDYLSTILVSSLQETIKQSENKHSGNLFRLAVEVSMMMNLLASGLNVDEEDVQKLRGRCLREVKESHGQVKFEDALSYQRSDD